MFHHSSFLRARFVRLLSYSLLAMALLSMAPDVALGQAVSSARPLVTELLGPLDLSRVHVGSPVALGVDYDWSGAGCKLRAGGFVQGRVVTMVKHSKTSKDTELQLLFESADCNGRAATPRGFTLVALIGTDRGTSPTGKSQVAGVTPLGGLYAAPAGIEPGGSLEASEANNLADPETRSLPAHIQIGQVVYLAQTSLRVGKGEAGATVIASVGRDVRLEKGSTLVLIVREAPGGTGAGTPAGSIPRLSTGANGSGADSSNQTPKTE